MKNSNLESTGTSPQKSPIIFSQEESDYILSHKEKTFLLGLDPYSGMDYFENYGVKYGYVYDVVALIEKETGLNIEIVGDKTWGEVVEGLKNGKTDILFGANATAERLKYMVFSKEITRYPYAAFAKKDSSVKTIADFDGKNIAFIEGDITIPAFLSKFNRIKPNIVIYPGQIEALQALSIGKIDGFVTSGGTIVNQFMYTFPEVELIGEIQTITSDMTLSTRKEDIQLRNIMNKIIEHYEDGAIKAAIEKAKIDFNRKILNLTKEEIDWLNNDGTAVAGMADDYLPFDYYEDGKYKGIGGAVLTKAADLVGIKLKVVHGDFSLVYQDAIEGKVDVINMSKSEDRLKYFLFTRPFSNERDMIYGKKDMPYIQDIYGLEEKRIAVIPGFWQYDSLRKNLSKAKFVEASNTEGCLRLIQSGKADYFIENPTVAEFYITGLGYPDITEKGITAADSFQYLAIYKNKKELASILDKSLQLVSYEQEKYNGLKDIPKLTPIRYKRMIFIIIGLLTLLALISFYVFQTLKRLADEKAQTHILKERTRLLYIDPLTGVRNRASFYDLMEKFDKMGFPQTIVTIDINNLKYVNDHYGHQSGDLLIKKCAEILQLVYFDEFVFRMGGDEFLVVYFPENAAHRLRHVDMVHHLASKAILEEDDKFKIQDISFAVGFASRNSTAESIEDTIKRSDNEMYANKKRMKAEKLLM